MNLKLITMGTIYGKESFIKSYEDAKGAIHFIGGYEPSYAQTLELEEPEHDKDEEEFEDG